MLQSDNNLMIKPLNQLTTEDKEFSKYLFPSSPNWNSLAQSPIDKIASTNRSKISSWQNVNIIAVQTTSAPKCNKGANPLNV